MDKKWFKHYVGMATDDKFKKIKNRVGIKHYAFFKMWTIVLERATKDGGWFRESSEVAHNTESLEVIFEEMIQDYDSGIVDEFFKEMVTERLLVPDLLGFYYVNHWEEYQHASLSTPRVQEHRENKQLETDVTDVIHELNRVTGKTFRAKTESHRQSIRGRFADGFTKEDMFVVIRHKQADWANTKYSKHMTPDTLFRPGNFDRYLNELTPGNREAIGSGTMLNVENLYGKRLQITQEQYDAAEKGFFQIVK